MTMQTEHAAVFRSPIGIVRRVWDVVNAEQVLMAIHISGRRKAVANVREGKSYLASVRPREFGQFAYRNDVPRMLGALAAVRVTLR